MEGERGRRGMMNRRTVVNYNNNNNNNSLDRMQALIKLDLPSFSLLFLLILVIISDQGTFQEKSSSSSARLRWLQYQTALSNTSPLGSGGGGGGESGNSNGIGGASGTSPSVSSSISSSSSVLSTSTKPSVVGTGVRGTGGGSGGGGVGLASTNANNNNNRNSYSYSSSYNNNNNNNRKRIDLQQRYTDGALFENNTSVNLTVPLGDTAFLRCRVRNLGERSISWIRRRDWHILTTGKTTYTNDERFHVLHSEGTDDWTLQIKFVQQRDNGTYECQISTGTGIISFMVNLLIAVPEAFILGNGDEYHVEQGSAINLVCVIEKSPKVPEFIFWYHNERMINYGSSREVTVRTESGARTQSRLTIRDARISDAGNYTCKTAHAEPAFIFVYVSEASGLFSGDKIAAIQRRKSSSASSSWSPHQRTLHHLDYLARKLGLSTSLTFVGGILALLQL